MKHKTKMYLLALALLITSIGYVISCTHKDILLPDTSSDSKTPTGTLQLVFDGSTTTFDKVHSNVMWETPYLGEISLLTGRFNTLCFTSFKFDESNPKNTSFEAYVWLNSVNTGEPGRDGGCLMHTFGTAVDAGDIDSNVAVIKSKSVALSTTGKGYTVTADLTFHGVTKEVKAQMDYDGVAEETFNGSTFNEYGFSLSFSILAKTDFGIQSTSIADNVNIRCNAAFKH